MKVTRTESNEINHGLRSTFEFPPYILDLVDTPEVQRMRGVEQLGFVPLVFPNATHGRFPHLIGTAENAMEMAAAILRKGPAKLDDFEKYVALAGSGGVGHDIAHWPLSHGLGPLGDKLLGKTHEQAGAELIAGDYSLLQFWQDMPADVVPGLEKEAMVKILKTQRNFAEVLSEHGICPETVAQLIDSERKKSKGDFVKGQHFLREIIDGKIVDADKLDYLKRDPRMAGVNEVNFDRDRVLASLGVIDWEDGQHLAVERKGIAALEDLLSARQRMFRVVYTHPTVLEHEAMVYEAAKRILTSMPDKYKTHLNLLDDRQFYNFLWHHARDDVEANYLATVRFGRQDRHRIAYGIDRRDIKSILENDQDEKVKIIQALQSIGGEFPEDNIKEEILKRANAGSQKPELGKADVIVYNRPGRLRTEEQFLNKFQLYVYCKKKIKGRNLEMDFSNKNPGTDAVYYAPDRLREGMHEDDLQKLFSTFTEHQISTYFAVLTPVENITRVKAATEDYLKELVF
jgi:HD superfamily phosphohydrolase